MGHPIDDDALRSRFERLQALQSAWGVIAPSRLFDEEHAIAESGRALSTSLSELVADDSSGGNEAAAAALDTRLDELEREMRDVALEIPVDQLRSTLPKRVALDRRGVLVHGTRFYVPGRSVRRP